MAWQTPKTDWKSTDVPLPNDFNRIEGNIQELKNTKETPAGAQAKANAAEQNAKNYTDTQIADLQQKKLDKSSYTATDVLNKLKTVDGHGSGLDADKLDGLHESIFMRKSANSNLDMNGHIITEVGQIQITDANTKIDEGSNNSVRLQTNSGYVDVGPQNTSYAHIYTDRPNFYFNKDILVKGSKVWHAGNDGSGSGLDADKLDGWHRDDIRNWNNILNKPSAFNPIGHKHSGSDITSAVANASNADTVDGKHADELEFKVNSGRAVFNESVPANTTVIKSIYVGSGYKAGRVIFIKSNRKGATGDDVAVVTFTTNKLDAVAYGTLYDTNKPVAIVTKEYESDCLIGYQPYYNLPFSISIRAINIYGYLAVKNVWLEGDYLKIEIQNNQGSSETLDTGIKWEVWG